MNKGKSLKVVVNLEYYKACNKIATSKRPAISVIILGYKPSIELPRL